MREMFLGLVTRNWTVETDRSVLRRDALVEATLQNTCTANGIMHVVNAEVKLRTF